jgi:hypothetical protein
MEDERLTIEAASELLQIEPATIEAWLKRGLRYGNDSDGTTLILRSDLDAFLAQEGQGASRDAATEN